MLVHVKKPHIDVKVTGQGVELVVESVPIKETNWFRSITDAVSQADILATYRGNSGILKSNLSAMENGKRTVGPKIARKLASAFGCDYRCFFHD